MRLLLTAFFAIGIAFATRSSANPASAIAIEPVIVLEREPLRYPATMRSMGVREGKVSLIVSVNERGDVTDIFIAESSRRAFAAAAIRSVERWTFQPAHYDGQAFPSTHRLELDFELGRTMPWQTFTAPAEANVTQTSHPERPITAHGLARLDSIPMPLAIEEPEATADAYATVEFYIDELGNVRAPKLVAGNDLEFGRRTIAALTRWRFQPPTAAGQRTNALVRQTFQWIDGQLSASRPL